MSATHNQDYPANVLSTGESGTEVIFTDQEWNLPTTQRESWKNDRIAIVAVTGRSALATFDYGKRKTVTVLLTQPNIYSIHLSEGTDTHPHPYWDLTDLNASKHYLIDADLQHPSFALVGRWRDGDEEKRVTELTIGRELASVSVMVDEDGTLQFISTGRAKTTHFVTEHENGHIGRLVLEQDTDIRLGGESESGSARGSPSAMEVVFDDDGFEGRTPVGSPASSLSNG